MTTLVVTNDAPPGLGGIEVMVQSLCTALSAVDEVVVLTGHAHQPGTRAADVAAPWAVYREPGTLLPSRRVAHRALELIDRHRVQQVVFGAAAPLGLLAPALRPHVERIVALSHGHECWWAQAPITRRALRRIGDHVDVLTTISEHTETMIRPALSPAGRSRLVRLHPPVDASFFTPATRTTQLPGPATGTVIAVARLVGQKGLATLLRAWPRVLDQAHTAHPGLVIVGDGPHRRHLQRRAPAEVELLGPVSHDQVPELMRAADLFALPVRSRLGGWYAEGFGLVFAEAQAAGLPVLAGASGGVREVVSHGHSGYLLDPEDPQLWADHLSRLLLDAPLRHRLGRAGRAEAERFSHSAFAEQVCSLVLGD